MHSSTSTSTATATVTVTVTPTRRRPAAHAGRLRIRVERRGGRSVVTCAAGHVPYAPRVVPGANGRARVLLVQTIAGPLAGDRVHVEIEVGPEASLELGANAATLALPADVPARHELHVRLHEGARLAFMQEPVVLAAGCDFVSSSELELAEGAAALVRDLVVLGRHAEATGRYRAHFRCELAGRPLFHDAVALGEASAASPVVLAGARVYGSLTLLGVEPDAPPTAGELALAGPGRVARALAADVPAARSRIAALQPVYLDALARLATAP